MENEKQYYLDTIKWLEKLIPIQETYSERVELRLLIQETKEKMNNIKQPKVYSDGRGGVREVLE